MEKRIITPKENRQVIFAGVVMIVISAAFYAGCLLNHVN